ncbi:hypothetical protein HDU93_008259 [Gonapodya sp. JEL0774]|nr:hypothetical protein HDU93_008259 [Gonapodya sp. JEL0774]
MPTPFAWLWWHRLYRRVKPVTIEGRESSDSRQVLLYAGFLQVLVPVNAITSPQHLESAFQWMIAKKYSPSRSRRVPVANSSFRATRRSPFHPVIRNVVVDMDIHSLSSMQVSETVPHLEVALSSCSSEGVSVRGLYKGALLPWWSCLDTNTAKHVRTLTLDITSLPLLNGGGAPSFFEVVRMFPSVSRVKIHLRRVHAHEDDLFNSLLFMLMSTLPLENVTALDVVFASFPSSDIRGIGMGSTYLLFVLIPKAFPNLRAFGTIGSEHFAGTEDIHPDLDRSDFQSIRSLAILPGSKFYSPDGGPITARDVDGFLYSLFDVFRNVERLVIKLNSTDANYRHRGRESLEALDRTALIWMEALSRTEHVREVVFEGARGARPNGEFTGDNARFLDDFVEIVVNKCGHLGVKVSGGCVRSDLGALME